MLTSVGITSPHFKELLGVLTFTLCIVKSYNVRYILYTSLSACLPSCDDLSADFVPPHFSKSASSRRRRVVFAPPALLSSSRSSHIFYFFYYFFIFVEISSYLVRDIAALYYMYVVNGISNDMVYDIGIFQCTIS